MPSTSSLVTSSVQQVPTSFPFFMTLTVAEVENVVHVVADKEDADTFALNCLMSSATCCLRRSERGRRLVHDQDLGLEIDGAGNCNDCR